MKSYKWTIAPLGLGTAIRDKSQSFLYRGIGVKLNGVILAWLLMKRDEKILVDTGACGPVKTPEFYKRYDQTPEQMMESQLMRFNTTPDEIKTVINTHLHLDHCAGNEYFTNAHFVVQKRGVSMKRNSLCQERG